MNFSQPPVTSLSDSETHAQSEKPERRTIVQLVYKPDLDRPEAERTAAMKVAAKKAEAALRKRRRKAVAAVRGQRIPLVPTSRGSSLERHARKCAICSHPERETIEELFLHWHSPDYISDQYSFRTRSLLRHAHATGIYKARQGNLRSVLDRILERAEESKVSADAVIRAVRAYSCLDDSNQWVDPPSRVIFSSAPNIPPRVSPPVDSPALPQGDELLIDTQPIKK